MEENLEGQQHFITCELCGKSIDRRDLGQELNHCLYDEKLKKYYCEETPKDIPYSSSRRIYDSVEWTRDKKPLNLNQFTIL
jgi:hypothetical protein